ncbi:uncharacterized protein EAF01_003239 [Botrytis porri]|uniref:uncharacterized protein n=1 Tax=Botrytis porri TaxID=87229 RepID=UPI0019007E19|nr:uncharacterized protein EAF01_003239 [Botrytis porri]KAF7909521.1 hypothetical protein EAF01_003239 [Botrytis porri]
MALGSDSSKMVLVLMDMPFYGRPRKPRPLISVITSAFVEHISDNTLGTHQVFQVFIDSGHRNLREGCSIR